MVCVKCLIRNIFKSAILSSWPKAEAPEDSSLRTRTKDDLLQDFIIKNMVFLPVLQCEMK